VLVAFSGHGIYDNGKSYLCPVDARVDDPKGTMVSMETVYERLNKCPAALRLLFVDACRNDPRRAGARSATPSEDRRKLGSAFERPPES
jgi:uncharacterized caspase-like protein